MGDLMDHRLLTRVALRNYKSIVASDTSLSQISFLVGLNSSGKSNFLDALHFVCDSLRFSLDHALRERGGLNDLRWRGSRNSEEVGIRAEFNLAESQGYYAFALAGKGRGGFEVRREECLVNQKNGSESHFYRVQCGEVIECTLSMPPAAALDRLFLVSMSGAEAFRPVYDSLSSMAFYNLNPDAIRDLQSPAPDDLLKRDGSNIASVLSSLAKHSPDFKKRIDEYLSKVAPGVFKADCWRVGPRETVQFWQQNSDSKHPWRFLASNMSDGTLRALGVLVALSQGAGNRTTGQQVVGIEEPEASLHPDAAGILVDAIQDAAQHTQVLVTSHSADLLDDIPEDSILAVVAEHGETRIGPLDEACLSTLRARHFTPGELMRINQLNPEPSLSKLQASQLHLFGPPL